MGSFKDFLKIAAPVAGALVGGPAGASVGMYLSSTVFGDEEPPGGLQVPAGLQFESKAADLKTQEIMFSKQLEFDREKFEYLKTQAKGPLGQTGSYGYPYVSVQPPKQQPSLMLPLAIGAGCFYFFIIRRKR